MNRATTHIAPGALDALRRARRVVVLTGAGISAESGVPTFRDAQTGLWARYRAEDLATPEAFARDPALVWNWYAWRRAKVTEAVPNAGHRALVQLAQQYDDFTLITQNVDGLHARAGSRGVLELHGSILRVRCGAGCGVIAEGAYAADLAPPPCPHCGAPLRPDVVWFGEALNEAHVERAFNAARECDLLISIGTSTLVQPAAGLPFAALASGARVLEINPQDTPLTIHASWAVHGPAGEVLPRLVAALAQDAAHASAATPHLAAELPASGAPA